MMAFRDEASSRIDDAASNLAEVEKTLMQVRRAPRSRATHSSASTRVMTRSLRAATIAQMCPYLNGTANKKEPHELFGVLHQFGKDIDHAHKENAEREAKVRSSLPLRSPPSARSRSDGHA